MVSNPEKAYYRKLASRVRPRGASLGPNAFRRYRFYRLGSTHTEVMILEGQRTNPLARDAENGVAHRRGNPAKSFFTDPYNWFVRRADKMDSYFRHFRRAQQRIVVK